MATTLPDSQFAPFLHGFRHHPQHRVAVHQAAVLIREQGPIGIAVECDAEVRTRFTNLVWRCSRCSEPQFSFMLRPSGWSLKQNDLRAEAAKQARAQIRSSTVRTIDHEFAPFKAEPTGCRRKMAQV